MHRLWLLAEAARSGLGSPAPGLAGVRHLRVGPRLGDVQQGPIPLGRAGGGDGVPTAAAVRLSHS